MGCNGYANLAFSAILKGMANYSAKVFKMLIYFSQAMFIITRLYSSSHSHSLSLNRKTLFLVPDISATV